MDDERWTYQEEMIRCGKPSCKSCPHGPYWYGYRHQGGRMKKKYLGKKDPRVEQQQAPSASRSTNRNRLDDIFDKQKRSYKLATEIFGLDTNSEISAKYRYRKLCMELHPDRCGGDDVAFKRVQAAYEYIRAYWRWAG